MRRAKHPVHNDLRGKIYTNLSTGLYEVTENGITYHMNLEHLRKLKQWWSDIKQQNGKPTVKGFYEDQDMFTRKDIKRTGV